MTGPEKWTWKRAPKTEEGFLAGAIYHEVAHDQTGEPYSCYIIKPHVVKNMGANGGRNGWHVYLAYADPVRATLDLGWATTQKMAKVKAQMNYRPDWFGLPAGVCS